MRRFPAFVVAVTALFAGCTAAPPVSTTPPPAAVEERIPLDPAVRHGVLPNGLTYYVRANARPDKRAELRLALNAGSLLETDEQRGLAHFVEHMAFNGTRNFEKHELVNYLERIGMRFGPDLNAYTSFDETVYMLQVPTDDPKIVDTAFEILHDWASAVTLEDEEIEKERGVVIEEWRLGRSAAGRIRDKQVPVLFHGSQYAERLPIGVKEVLESAPPAQLRQFYRDWYRPDLAAVIAVGDFDPDAIEALIREKFGRIPAAAGAPPRNDFPIPDHAETLMSVVTDPEATDITVSVQYKRPPVRRRTVAELRQFLVDALYHTMMNGRLSELARTADPPFQFAFAGSGPLGRTKSSYTLQARANNGGVQRALSTLLTEARRVETFGFAQTELDRAKASFLRGIDRYYEERDKHESAQFASQYVSHFLRGDAVPAIETMHRLYHELVPSISLQEINARADQWITDTNRVILASGPDKKEAAIPTEAELLRVFEATQQAEVTPWTDRFRDEPLVAQVPAPGRVVEESAIPEVGVTRWRLSNGAVVYLKPTDFKNDEVVIRGWSPGGHSLAPDAVHLSATRAADIAGRMGRGNFDAIELGRALTGKVASVNAFITELNEGIRGMASPRDLETALQLLYLQFTGTRRDEKAFAAYTSSLRGQLENQEASPGYWFSRRMNEVLTQDHPRRRILTPSDVDRIDLDAALDAYRDRFADASDFLFTFVGNFDLATMRPLVEQWIASLPTSGRKESWRDIGVRRPPGVQNVRVTKGIEPRSSVRIIFHGDARWSVDEAHQLASLREILRIRLREELREEMGGVYGVGTTAFLSRHPREEYTVSITFSADPQRVDELIQATFAEIERLRSAGPSEDHVSRVREMQRRSRQTELRQNGFWAFVIEDLVSEGLPLTEILRHEERIAAVTAESMRAAANRYLDRSQMVVGVLEPEK